MEETIQLLGVSPLVMWCQDFLVRVGQLSGPVLGSWEAGKMLENMIFAGEKLPDVTTHRYESEEYV